MIRREQQMYLERKRKSDLLLEALKEVEWEMMQDGWSRECPWCLEEESKGHAENCSRQHAIIEAEKDD